MFASYEQHIPAADNLGNNMLVHQAPSPPRIDVAHTPSPLLVIYTSGLHLGCMCIHFFYTSVVTYILDNKLNNLVSRFNLYFYSIFFKILRLSKQNNNLK